MFVILLGQGLLTVSEVIVRPKVSHATMLTTVKYVINLKTFHYPAINIFLGKSLHNIEINNVLPVFCVLRAYFA